MKKILLLLVAIAWTSTSCEKDDLCDPTISTTPQMIIHFYDITNPTLDKAVTSLLIIGEGAQDSIQFNAKSVIKVPLRTTADITKYRFILNYGNTDPSFVNEDEIEFKYTRQNIFVSRACGFKTIFILDNTNPYTLTDNPTPDQIWMKNVTVSQPNILAENEIHLKVSF